MWINYTFHHMTDVEKSEISFIMCTIYGVLWHFRLFCCKKFIFLQFTQFFAKPGCCNLRAIVSQKQCLWRKNDKYEVCTQYTHQETQNHSPRQLFQGSQLNKAKAFVKSNTSNHAPGSKECPPNKHQVKVKVILANQRMSIAVKVILKTIQGLANLSFIQELFTPTPFQLDLILQTFSFKILSEQIKKLCSSTSSPENKF